MSVRTRLQPRFLIQRLAMIVICLVLGLWGVYDYAVKIPNAEAMVARKTVYADAWNVIQKSGDPEVPRADVIAAAEQARTSIEAARERLPEGIEGPETLDATLRPRDMRQWAAELALMEGVVRDYASAPAGAEVSPLAAQGAELIRQRQDITSEVTPPTKFDRLTQWFFILCLPFVPWYTWTFFRESRRVHRLEEDGTFVGPDIRWEREEIADIDMRQWMRKSVAAVIHQDGRRETLDDYVHRGVEEIVGTIAHRIHPSEWTPEAKPVKKDDPEDAAPEDADAGAPAGDDEASDDSPATRPDGTAAAGSSAGAPAETAPADADRSPTAG